jgi:hypothetical protein
MIVLGALYYKFVYLIKKDIEINTNTKSLVALDEELTDLKIKYNELLATSDKINHHGEIENLEINNKLTNLINTQDSVSKQLFVLIEKQDKRLEKMEEVILLLKDSMAIHRNCMFHNKSFKEIKEIIVDLKQ